MSAKLCSIDPRLLLVASAVEGDRHHVQALQLQPTYSGTTAIAACLLCESLFLLALL